MRKPDDLIGPYRLIRKLGEGGFGEVWLAQDLSGPTPREVAVKTPLKSEVDLDALLQEATVWARATGHPNVLEFLAARVFDGQIALVSEYAPDGSLTNWLRRRGGRAPSAEAAVEMARGILAGLEHLHARNIIHRDVKPDNVLLTGAIPRLADFGISRVIKSTSKSAVSAGTPLYMAPEAFNRRRNQQTDLWSVGVILYQMLSGRLPFAGADVAELYGAIVNEDPEPLPEFVPEWLRQAVAKALAKEPERRYRTAVEMRAALAAPAPRIEENPGLPQSHTAPIGEPPSKREPALVALHPPERTLTIADPPRTNPLSPAPPSHRLSKWLTGLLAGVLVIATAIYLAVHMTPDAAPPPSFTGGSAASAGTSFTEDLNGVKLEMVGVPKGEFLMGSPENEEGRGPDGWTEGPQHRVNVKAFSIGKYEITQAQWKAVMGGKNPSKFNGDDRPVESVFWGDAKEFCQKLAEMTGKRYGLPSEAEWEYACRAGTTGAYAGNLDAMAWFTDNSGAQTNLVGRKQANAFGLYDMHGNVWEWCEDFYHSSYNGKTDTDGSAWLSGEGLSFRVMRGGAWRENSGGVRSAIRGTIHPSESDRAVGFRVVVSARAQ